MTLQLAELSGLPPVWMRLSVIALLSDNSDQVPDMSKDVRQRSLDEVRRIVTAHLAGRRARVFLFGSCARGDAAVFSDIDVAVEPLEPIPASVFVDIGEELEESTVPYFVDVVDLSTASESLRAAVRHDGIEWTG